MTAECLPEQAPGPGASWGEGVQRSRCPVVGLCQSGGGCEAHHEALQMCLYCMRLLVGGVSERGMCGRAQMLCVSEYLPNGNLETAIRKDRERKDGKPRLLGWYMQGRPIAVDAARGLAFLHTHKARARAWVRNWWVRAALVPNRWECVLRVSPAGNVSHMCLVGRTDNALLLCCVCISIRGVSAHRHRV